MVGMKSVDKLREYIWQHATNNDKLRTIADEIEQEHECLMEKEREILKQDKQDAMEKMADSLLEQVASEYVRLPKDIHDETIHLGEMLQSSDGMVGEVLELKWCCLQKYPIIKLDVPLIAEYPSEIKYYFPYEVSHYKPTAEYLLREYYERRLALGDEDDHVGDDAFIRCLRQAISELDAEYATKLRLVDE